MSNYVVRLIGIVCVLTFGIQTKAWCMGEPFDYAPGNIVTVSGGIWTSWGTPTTPVNVVTDTVGDRVQLTAANSDKVARAVPANDGLLYLRVKINVTVLPTASTGEYFLSYRDPISGRCLGRLFIKQFDSTHFTLGVAYAAISPNVTWAAGLSLNTDYTVVMKLNTTTKVVTLWVNPTLETSTNISSSDTSSSSPYTTVELRQSSLYGGIGTLYVDNLLVGESWNEVFGNIWDVTLDATQTLQTGAIRNSPSTDCQPGIQAVIAAARTSNQHAIIIFPTGTYYITGEHVQTYGGGNNIMYFNAIGNNLVVDGSESTIQVQSVTNSNYYVLANLMYFPNAPASSTIGTTVKEFTFDWTRPPFTVGTVGSTVTTLGPSGNYTQQWQFTVTADSGYSLPPDSGNANRWAVEALTDMDPTTGLPIGNLKVINNGTNLLTNNYISWSLDPTNTIYTITVRSISPTTTQDGMDRLTHLGLAMAALPGKKLVLRHPMTGMNNLYGPDCIYFNGCSNIFARDLTIHASTGMGIRSFNCTNLTFNRVDLQPSNGRLLSTLVDGTFFNYCQGTITLENGLYQATGDDSANVWTKYLQIKSITGNQITAEAYGGGSPGVLPIAGETFEFFSEAFHIPYLNGSSDFLGTVQSASLAGAVETITFNSLPTGLQVNDFIISQMYSPTLNVTNCTFNGGLARGLLAQTNSADISGSTFENIVYNGIFMLANPIASGDQGPGSQNVTINSCLFAGCGAAAIATSAPSGDLATRTSAAGMFGNLTIINNAFNPEGTVPINYERIVTTTSGAAGEDVLAYYTTSGLFLEAVGGTTLIQNNIFGTNNVNNGYQPAVFLTHCTISPTNASTSLSLLDNQATGQGWIRTHYTADGTGNDPVPNFGSTPIGDLISTDEQQVSGGVPLTLDSAYIGYVRQLGDIQ